MPFATKVNKDVNWSIKKQKEAATKVATSQLIY